MIDNWTLQEVENLLSGGLDGAKVGGIVVSTDRSSHDFSPDLEAAIRIDALLTLLTNIVFFESLHVDHGFVNSWRKNVGHLSPLERLGIVAAVDYNPHKKQLQELSDVMLEELCVTPTLKSSMQEIKSEWANSGRSSDPHLSALVWGSAGMLARSHVTATPYFGHPLRRRLLNETRMFSPKNSAVERFDAFLLTQRTKMFRYRAERLTGTFGHMVLPPVAVQIIEEAASLEDLLPVAVQVRDQNSALRSWLSEYQGAIDVEDERKRIKFETTLASLAKSMEVKYGADKAGSVGISLNTAFFKIDVPRSIVDRIRNSIGIRATLSNLILTSRGHQAIGKLLTMLGEGRSALGREITSALHVRYAP